MLKRRKASFRYEQPTLLPDCQQRLRRILILNSSASNTDFLALLSRELLNRIQRLSEGFSIACQKELLKSFQGTNNCKGLRTALNQAAQSSYGQVQGNISHETSNNSGFFTANGNSRIAASNSTESSPAVGIFLDSVRFSFLILTYGSFSCRHVQLGIVKQLI
ncbi:uncharacterized protein Gasu_58280 [Galdieria sulphuraria]|uniref:Uncharacterized protein n=1 Tax=Galdieria sulphuraria TaxID=130081 RepID=M2WRY3_GALSU|nr:uncharacterized protein Gasu_58280 [Galdieria sulphuraria]EME26595.1 hypothetical protein Gasu_58280 [Galdieria sulphuraria]|eukprot:XP_005703115.1 hypothetical protein Gasu_58280 [Galdieria sulphuraria]